MPYLEQQFAPAGMCVVVIGDNAVAVDGRDREEEDAVIIVAEGNDARWGVLSRHRLIAPPPFYLIVSILIV